jgi:hypothetical protein
MEAPLTEDMKVRKREIFLSLGEQALFISWRLQMRYRMKSSGSAATFYTLQALHCV